MNCQKRYEGGQMVCPRCNMFWDLNDQKPRCLTNKEYGNQVLNNLKMTLESKIYEEKQMKEL